MRRIAVTNAAILHHEDDDVDFLYFNVSVSNRHVYGGLEVEKCKETKKEYNNNFFLIMFFFITASFLF